MNLDFGYSPCPNDTFMFWAWAFGRVASPLSLRPRLEDIQELNRLALTRAPLPLTKASASTYLDPEVRQRYRLLNVGAALGRGCGPLIVNREGPLTGRLRRLAVPGFDTTACRLARAALGDQVDEWVELRYDEIMPAILGSTVDAGVIIHESRFTYQSQGLKLALDLGLWWEERTGLPLPLGVMLARRDLEESVVSQAETALAASIRLAWQTFQGPADAAAELWTYLRAHAIELDDNTMAAHINLYVNDFSLDLGAEGREALRQFSTLP